MLAGRPFAVAGDRRHRRGVAVTVGVIAVALVQAASASASISMSRPNFQIVVADDNGGHAKAVGLGVSSYLSPNGVFIALRGGDHCAPSAMQIVRVATGAAVQAPGAYSGCWPSRPAWSPDSRTLYTLRFDDRDGTNPRLVSVDAATGTVTVLPVNVGRLTFDEPSLSPDGTRLAYTADLSGSALVFRTALRVLDLRTHAVRTLRTGKILGPVFGPTRIAFSLSRAVTINGGLTFTRNTAVIAPNGRGYRVLTHAAAGREITPWAYSGNGRRLLGGTGTDSVAINPVTGAVRTLARKVLPAVLSRDGRFMLGFSFSGNGIALGNTWRIAWAPGGPRKLLARHATFPSLSR